MLVVQLFYQRPGIRCGQPSEQRQVLFVAQLTFLAVCEFAVQVIVVVITHRRETSACATQTALRTGIVPLPVNEPPRSLPRTGAT